MTIGETVKWFNSIFDINKEGNQTKSDFGVGVTTDIDQVKKEKGGLLLGVSRCSSRGLALSLIENMQSDGFEVDGDSIQDSGDTFFVYLYKLGGSHDR